MEKKLWVIDYESANYAGAGEYVTVWAVDEDEACDLASHHMENYYYEQDSDQYYDENGETDDITWSHVTRVELMETSPHKEFWEKDKTYYPCVN